MIQGKRQSTDLSGGMEHFLQVIGKEEVKENSLLHQAWEIVAPERVLDHTDSVRYSNKKRGRGVIIFLDDPVWVAECDMSRDSYKILLEQRLNEQLEELHFYLTKDERFKTTFLKRDSQGKLVMRATNSEEERPSFLDDGTTGEVSLQEMRIIGRKCSFIEDELLRESVSKAMKSNLEWKKGKETVKRR